MVKLLLSLVILMAVIGMAALVAGADTRDGNDWFLHRPVDRR